MENQTKNKKIIIISPSARALANASYPAGMEVRDISYEKEQEKAFEEAINEYKEKNPNFEVIVVDGDTDLSSMKEFDNFNRSEEMFQYNSPYIKGFEMLDPNVLENYYIDTTPKKYRNLSYLPVNTEPKSGRNSPCSCNSGKKTKNCCK